jgi:regulatory protein
MYAAAAFLAVRPRSVAETRRRLHTLGYPDALVGQVVDRLVSIGYLDDLAFARAWVESRDRAHPRGSLALRQELAQKGVARDVVEDILGERAETAGDRQVAPGVTAVAHGAAVEDEAAERLLGRKGAMLAREADPRRRRQKAYALLARHGFPPDVCRRLAASVAVEAADVAEEDADGPDGPV